MAFGSVILESDAGVHRGLHVIFLSVFVQSFCLSGPVVEPVGWNGNLARCYSAYMTVWVKMSAF